MLYMYLVQTKFNKIILFRTVNLGILVSMDRMCFVSQISIYQYLKFK